MSADCVMLMSSVFWKCLFSTSSMARAKPHIKNSEVMSTNGTMYCLLLSDIFFFSICLLRLSFAGSIMSFACLTFVVKSSLFMFSCVVKNVFLCC